jgi:hypothetical protein
MKGTGVPLYLLLKTLVTSWINILSHFEQGVEWNCVFVFRDNEGARWASYLYKLCPCCLSCIVRYCFMKISGENGSFLVKLLTFSVLSIGWRASSLSHYSYKEFIVSASKQSTNKWILFLNKIFSCHLIKGTDAVWSMHVPTKCFHIFVQRFNSCAGGAKTAEIKTNQRKFK